MPEQSGDRSCLDLKGKTLSGWEEIRSALYCVEELRNNDNQHARVEVIERSKESSLTVSLRNVRELDDYMKLKIKQKLLERVGGSLELDEVKRITREVSDQIEVECEVYGQVRLD